MQKNEKKAEYLQDWQPKLLISRVFPCPERDSVTGRRLRPARVDLRLGNSSFTLSSVTLDKSSR